MHGNAANFLAGIVRDSNNFAVPALLRQDLLLPSQKFGPVSGSRKIYRASGTRFPVNPHRQPRRPAGWCDVTAPTTSALLWTNNVNG